MSVKFYERFSSTSKEITVLLFLIFNSVIIWFILINFLILNQSCASGTHTTGLWHIIFFETKEMVAYACHPSYVGDGEAEIRIAI
jgi:hypothetical protein